MIISFLHISNAMNLTALKTRIGLVAHGMSTNLENLLNSAIFTCTCLINFFVSHWHRKVLNSSVKTKSVEAKISTMAMLSHDLRQPVHTLSMLVRLMKVNLIACTDIEDRSTLLSDLLDMGTVVEHCASLVNDFLLFAKMSKQVITNLDLQPASLEDITANVRAICAELSQQTGNQLLVPPLVGLSNCWNVDSKNLTRVLVNLVSNGLNYTRAGGSVTLRVSPGSSEQSISSPRAGLRKTEKLIAFSVTDTGCGISAEDLKDVFKPFSRGSRDNLESDGHTDLAGGTGLGLTITHMLVKMMGGDISVSSVVGQGTTFSFCLSLTPADVPAAVQSDFLLGSPSALSQKKRPAALPSFTGPLVPQAQITVFHILVVDDVKLNRSLLHRCLQVFLGKYNASSTVVYAVNGLDAVEKFKISLDVGARFDAVFVDREMPVMNGVEATRRMVQLQAASESKSHPSAFVSLSASIEDNADWFAAGLTASLGKPFTTKDLYKLFQTLSAGAQTWSLSPKFMLFAGT
jgi:signal transduction histidine kinase